MSYTEIEVRQLASFLRRCNSAKNFTFPQLKPVRVYLYYNGLKINLRVKRHKFPLCLHLKVTSDRKKLKSDAKPNETNFRFDFKARILCGIKYFRTECDYHSKVLRFLKKVGLEVYVSGQLTNYRFVGHFPAS